MGFGKGHFKMSPKMDKNEGRETSGWIQHYCIVSGMGPLRVARFQMEIG